MSISSIDLVPATAGILASTMFMIIALPLNWHF
jgi:hypothetical protein